MLATLFPSIVSGAAYIAILGGLVAAVRGVVKVTKVIDGQLEAMRDNTAAVNHLTDKVEPLAETVQEHSRRLHDLERARARSAVG